VNDRRAVIAVALTMITVGALAACSPSQPATPAPASTAASQSSPSSSASPSSSSPASPSPSPSKAANAVTLDITISAGQVDPNGKKIDVQRGQTIVLNVTSDEDDEIHAHTGDQGYELEVKGGKTTRGEFVVSAPGRFDVESHHLEKVIVILNVR
jgi:FtsP/CotA-like multicopper oxidase with cupredoxin domain